VTVPASSIPSIRYLALGDSYTIGESVPASGRWPNQIAALLGNDFNVDVTIIARTGWTTGELWQGIQAADPKGPYDLVSILIGVNNQYRGYDKTKYRDEFRFLLEKAVEFAGGDSNRVFVLSIPDWSVTPFADDRDGNKISQEVAAFNSINYDESQKANVHYVDITPTSLEAANDPSLIASDGLHPSVKMYAEWAKLALPVVKGILE